MIPKPIQVILVALGAILGFVILEVVYSLITNSEMSDIFSVRNIIVEGIFALMIGLFVVFRSVRFITQQNKELRRITYEKSGRVGSE